MMLKCVLHIQVVAAFYAFWESYCTAKSYVWAEKYNTREAPNRQIRRLMEQDNKKLRDKAKKEHNEEVRVSRLHLLYKITDHILTGWITQFNYQCYTLQCLFLLRHLRKSLKFAIDNHHQFDKLNRFLLGLTPSDFFRSCNKHFFCCMKAFKNIFGVKQTLLICQIFVNMYNNVDTPGIGWLCQKAR